MTGVKGKEITLSPELLEKARVELNEIPSDVPEHIQALREKILENPTFNFRSDDNFLLRFLRCRKYDQEKAFELMTKYYKQRESYPTLFRKTKDEFEKILAAKIVNILPDRDAEGRIVILLRSQCWDTAEISIDDIMFHFYVALEVLVEDEAIQINGVVWIIDWIALNVNHALQFTPWKIKECVTVLMQAFPYRVKGLHGVNEFAIVDGIYAIVKTFLSKKLKDRVIFHGKCFSSLHEYVGPDMLPEELGGNLDSLDQTHWNTIFLQNFDHIMEDFNFGFIHQETVPLTESTHL